MAAGKKTGGRSRGTPNKATAGLKAAFQKHEAELVRRLLALTKSTDENVQLRAVQACFERGWGKPAQPITGEDGEGPAVVEIIRRLVSEQPDASSQHTNGKDISASPDA